MVNYYGLNLPKVIIPVGSSDDKIYLPSTDINKGHVHVVAAEHKNLQNKNKATTLCQLLAREFFLAKM